MDKLRSEPASTFTDGKPLAISETGVAAYIGGFTDVVGGVETPQFGRPFWYQEQGRYIAAMVTALMGLDLIRVSVFTLVQLLEPGNAGDRWFIEEGSFGLMERELSGVSPQHRGSINAIAKAWQRPLPGGLTYRLRTSEGEVWLQGAP